MARAAAATQAVISASETSAGRPSSTTSTTPPGTSIVGVGGGAPAAAAATSQGPRAISPSAPFHRHEGPLALAEVDLGRPPDLLLGILEHLLPLGEPARRARNREEHREGRGRDPERLVDQAGVEVDVRVELALDEVLILERDPLELERDVEERVPPRDLEDLLRHPLDDLRARIEVLVDAVAESHQPLLAAPLLDLLDEGGDVRDRADLLE